MIEFKASNLSEAFSCKATLLKLLFNDDLEPFFIQIHHANVFDEVKSSYFLVQAMFSFVKGLAINGFATSNL